MKVISLVQHDDHMLASAIVSSRQTILGLALGPDQIRQPLKENP